jgi:phospholipid-translocating ATPase
MQFRKCSVGDGSIYGSTNDDSLVYTELVSIVKEKNHEKYSKLHELLLAISLCHSVLVQGTGDKISYKSQSPDESALITAAKNIGYVLTDRNNDNVVTVEILRVSHQYKLLNVIEFNSDRKVSSTDDRE